MNNTNKWVSSVTAFVNFFECIYIKVQSRTDHEGPEGEWWYSSALSLT